LIAAFGGDTVAAALAFADAYVAAMDITVLVDFENDSARTAVAVADALGERLHAVRLDTSDQLADLGLARRHGADAPRGVAPELVRLVRGALDERGHTHVRIVVSGGFTTDRIRAFEAEGVPVDVYGVGSSLLRGSNDFTADVVEVEGRPGGKVGRSRRPSTRLERVV
jgi:nicotinate phosphoribosyltransferase